MILLELFVLVIVFGIGVVQIILDHVWSDKRTKLHKRIKILLLILMLVLLIGSASLRIVEDSSSQQLMEKVSSLQIKNDSLMASVREKDKTAHKDMIALQGKITDLESKLEPFIEIAISKYPNLGVDIALNQLSREIAEAKEMAKPNTLSYSTITINKKEKGYVAFILFKPAKDEPIGHLEFTAALPLNTKARILEFSQSCMAVDVRRSISVDGKSAKLTYSPMGGADPAIQIIVSDTTHVRIVGNRGLGSKIISVK